MPDSHRKLLAISIFSGLFLLAIVAALGASTKARQAVRIVRWKLSGSLSDVTWLDLFRLTRPGSHGNHFNLVELASTPNPYAAIRNAYSSPEDLSAGKLLFDSHCALCHGANGSGGPGGPALQRRQMVQGSSDWAIFRTISFGIPKTAMQGSQLTWPEKWRLVAYVKSLLPLVGVPVPVDSNGDAGIRALVPVSYEDIRAAEGLQDRWLTYSGSYDGHRFSSLSQITPGNASRLRLLWMRQYNTSEPALETSPLVVGGYMFVTIPPNRVEALNVKTGALVWAYDRHLPDHLALCCGYPNRGLAVLGNILFYGTLDAHLVALDIATGEVRWDVEVADYKAGYSITAAPLTLKNLVVTGVAGGEYGIRGFVEAREAATGKQVWRFYTVPQSGESGADTWEGDSWKTGGSPTWLTGSFDPETNLIFWPTGNPSPNFEGKVRKGDNLYTNCVIALDADHGTMRWHFQFSPHDLFDWDATEILVLIDRNVAGKPRHYLAQANRNGFYYLLDRESGQFLLARQFAKETWAENIDDHGRPVLNPGSHPSPQGTLIYPSAGGATNWESPSYSPATGLFYVSAIDQGAIFYENHEDYHRGEPYAGGSTEFFRNIRPLAAVRALDVETGELRWEFRNPTSGIGGLLSTQGGLLFGAQSETFFALDALTGREIWRVETGGPIRAAPISFLSEGKQVVTIAAGHDLLTFGL
jgi:alcohol dehydrogenase (cytochrome c)